MKYPIRSNRLYIGSLAMATLLLVAYVVSNLLTAAESGGGRGVSVHWVALFVVGCIAWLAIRIRHSRTQHTPTGVSEYKMTVRTLAAVVDACDPFTQGRSYRISRFAVRVGEHLGISGQGLDDLEYAALLHDIGKTAVHYGLLLKTGRLSDEEMAALRTHPEVSHGILKDIPCLIGAAEIIHAHHEQPDGQGYPRGLKGEEIPLGSRIIMVVAAFDAMTTDRPYRRGLSSAEAYDELRACSGNMFFPEVVSAFIQLHKSRDIFDGFDRDELEMYRSGQYSSRAFEELLGRVA